MLVEHLLKHGRPGVGGRIPNQYNGLLLPVQDRGREDRSFGLTQRPAAGVGASEHQQHTRFPKDIQGIATSLKLETGKNVNRTELVLSLLQNLDSEYENFLQGKKENLIRKWTQQSDMFGKTVTVYQKDKTLVGIALRLNPEGKLTLQTPDGEQRLLDSGELLRQTPVSGD